MKQMETTMAKTETVAAEDKPSTVEWVLWKHHCPIRVAEKEEWKDDMNEQVHFFAHPTKEDFHMDLNILPLPSKTFFLKTTVNLEGEHQVCEKHSEYSLFQKGIPPEWEDDHNVGELSAKHYFPPELLDRYWLQLAHGVMEGKIDHKYVCGIRVVDRSKGKHPVYKLELWLNTSDSNVHGTIRKQALECVQQDEHHRFNFHWRDFSSSSCQGVMASSETTASENSLG
jgi:hypothetical protein